VQPGPQHEVPFQQGPGAGEDVENLLLRGVHAATLRQRGEKTKSFFRRSGRSSNLNLRTTDLLPRKDTR
jgi:hypothetical protein